MSTTAHPPLKARSSGRLLYREANDRVRKISDGRDGEVRPFFCECHDASCTEAVRMTLAEYDAVCVSGTYAIVPGHEDRRRDVVIGSTEAYAIVCAAGAA